MADAETSGCDEKIASNPIQRSKRNDGTRKAKPARRGILSRFHRSEDGAAAVEFAIVVLPFFMLVGFIFELGMGYLANKVLNFSVDNVARQIRVGDITLAAGATAQDRADAMTAFRKELCEENYGMEIFFDCEKLLIDVKTIATWGDGPEDPDRDETPVLDDDGNVVGSELGDINSSGFTFDPGGRLSINVVRVYYDWPTILDFNDAQSKAWVNDKRLMSASAAFLTEPF